MADDLTFSERGAHATIAPRTPTPGEEVWRLQSEARIVTCELRDDSRVGLGWDVQLLEGGELQLSKRCPTEGLARWVGDCFLDNYVRASFTEARATTGTISAGHETTDGPER